MLNETLQQELLAIVKESHQGILQGLEFAKTKTPELIHQIYTFGVITNTMYIIFICLGIIVSFLIALFLEEYSIFIVTFIGFLVLIIPLYNLIQIQYSPYLYLINFIKNQ
jgi:hypothetical protein